MSMSSTPGQTGNSGKSMSGSQPGMTPEQQSQIQAQQGFFNDTIAPAMQSNTWSGSPQDMYNQYQNTVMGGTGGKGMSNQYSGNQYSGIVGAPSADYNLGPTPNPMLGGQPARDPQYAGMPDDMYGRMMADQQREQAFQQQNPGMPMLRDMAIRDYDQYMNDQRRQQQQAPGPTAQMPSLMEPPQPTPAPSQNNLADVLSQYQPPASPPSLVQEIQQPTAPAPAPVQQPMAAPAPVPVARPAQPAPRPALRPAPAPVARPAPRPVQQPIARPAPRPVAPRPAAPLLRQPTPTARSSNMVMAPGRQAVPQPMARSVSRVNPPLLPTRPTGRR